MIGELAALGAAISWTISALLYKEALRKTKPVSANIVRLVCTGAILVTFMIAIGRLGVFTSLPADMLVLAAVSGLIGLGIGDTLYMFSLKSIGVCRAVPITCIYPLFNIILAIFLIGEPFALSIILGAVIIVVGIWLLSQEKDDDEAKLQKGSLFKGMIAALATAVVWSISITMINLAVKQAPDLDHALAINTFRVMAIAVSLLAVSPIIDRSLGFVKVDRKTVLTLITGGVVALGLGWFFLTYSFIGTLESRAVPISSTTPLFSTLAGIIFLHEKVNAKNVLGSVLIVVGISLIFLV